MNRLLTVKALSNSFLSKRTWITQKCARWYRRTAENHSASKSLLPSDGRTLADFLVSAQGQRTNTAFGRERSGSLALLERQRDPKRKRPTVGASESVVQALENIGQGAERVPPAPYKVLLETYGCAMNVSDSEIVASLLAAHPEWFRIVNDSEIPEEQADIILLNSCAIREKPEARVLQRLRMLRAIDSSRGGNAPRRILGLLGCMAERLKTKLLSGTPSMRVVDLVVGPDGYRDLPVLLQGLMSTNDPHRYAYHTQLSLEETYADIAPLRQQSRITAYLSIMRGCDNHCAFCVVPQTRGPERSRDPHSIWQEVQRLGDEGFREVVLLGQNVNSYRYRGNDLAPRSVSFAELLHGVCEIADRYPMRVRFTSPHPKDFPDEVLELYTKFAPRTLCRQIHVPLQSGSTTVLQRMRRGYTREEYLALIARIFEKVGANVALSTDIISGFCDETEEEHAETLSLMDLVRFDQAFMFAYSERERTIAARLYVDNVPLDVKQRRLREIITKQVTISSERARAMVGTTQRVLIDESVENREDGNTGSALNDKSSSPSWIGRTESNRRVRIHSRKPPHSSSLQYCEQSASPSPGDWVNVCITGLNGNRLVGELSF
ncbi:hypothetical protein F1559_004259 [Cyanidiococcus yangmingshanensis]|uniref:Uncharacterized protein n=1 Tax=Cyanidiococcus yangmingshanensis TaxID=2690220 RepID=A0A7J7IIQ2_9RHOD|nr:hypothetical protein F1559_004259 [Cyanidiococcus yangmingshanensis]